MSSLYPDYQFQSRHAQVGDTRMHYIDEGSGPVILMVHGNPTWSYYFRQAIHLLSPHFRVIAPDHIGCGFSDKPQHYQYTLNHHVDNLQKLLDHLAIDRYSLMVHDWGGAIGLGVATRDPSRVEKIVVHNTAAFRSTRIPLRISLCRIPVFGEILVRGLNGFAWPATFMAVTSRMRKEVCAAYLAPYDSWKNRVAIFAFVRDIPLTADHVSYPELVRIENGLQCLRDDGKPMLILWGGKDFCFDASFYREWRNRFPEAETHYFHDGGHYLLEDKFQQVAPLLLRFFGITDLTM